jgi:hypothetical protein
VTQSIEYVVRVNADQAAEQIAAVEKRFGGVDNAAKRAGESIERAAGAKRNFGQAALEASRAVEDLQYGISGVINNIPSLVMGLGMSAGVAGALSLVAVAANQVIKNMDGFGPSTEKAAKEAKEHITRLRDEIAGLDRDLRALQVGAERAAMEAQAERVRVAAEAAQAALAPLGGLERFERLKDNDKLVGGIKRTVDEARKAVELLDLEMSKLAAMRRIQLEKAAKKQLDLLEEEERKDKKRREKEREKLQKKARAKAEKEAEQLARLRYEMYLAELEAEDKALAEVSKARKRDEKKRHRDEVRALAKEFRERDREEARLRRERLREERRVQREIMRGEKELAEYRIKLMEQVTSSAMGTLTDYLVAKVEGEKDAEKKAVASFLSSTGRQLVASGVRGIFEGAILSANPLTATSGAGMIMTGSAAVAAGLAMAGGGAVVGASLRPPDVASPSSSMRDPGASPRLSGGDGDGGGPLVVNITYGVSGPLPEDTARAIRDATRSAGRRGGR